MIVRFVLMRKPLNLKNTVEKFHHTSQFIVMVNVDGITALKIKTDILKIYIIKNRSHFVFCTRKSQIYIFSFFYLDVIIIL